MTSPHRNLRDHLRDLWGRLRQLSRDDAYDRYVAHHAVEHAGSEPLSAREFYLREQQRKWSGVSRCC